MSSGKATDWVTVVHGAEKYSPVQYNIVEVGPFSMTTAVREGETAAQAMDRAREVLKRHARKAFITKLNTFLQNLTVMGRAVERQARNNASDEAPKKRLKKVKKGT